MTQAVLGIIGGSGIYDLPGLKNVRETRIESPWGEPSAPLRVGDIDGLPIVFLSRHDKGHRLSPSDINYRANVDMMKRAGVTDLVSLSACGSFKEELPPGTFVLIDQFVDRTFARASSFFGKGCVAHVSMAHPVSPRLRLHLAAAAEAEGINVVRSGTYICMEGPQFSTLAESLTYKGLGYSVIGMTNLPEAKLAREAEICYATVAMVTDFDCWHPDHDEGPGRHVLPERAAGRQRDEVGDAGALQHVDISAVVDVGGRQAVALVVARQEDDRQAADLADARAQTRAHRVCHRYVCHHALPEERALPLVGPVDKLIDQHEGAGRQLLFE
jgi:5'-methylthioadenosine phosphorylase